MKKPLLYSIIGGFLLIIVVSFFAVKSHSNKRFEKNMSATTTSLLYAAYIAENATSEYSKIWLKKINSRYGSIWVDGENKYFSDFSEAVSYRITQFKENGALDKMDSLMNVSTNLIQEIDASLFGRKETKDCIKALYLDVSDYCSLANSPTGSLQSFNSKTGELSGSIERKLRELKLYLPKE